MHPIRFIITLFCVGVGALLSGGARLYENLEYRYNGRVAVMQLADPGKTVYVQPGGYDTHLLDVRYVGPDGEVVVRQKSLGGDKARRLAAGGRIPVTYLKHRPNQVLYEFEDPPNPWGLLVAGGVLLALALYALKLMRREAEGS